MEFEKILEYAKKGDIKAIEEIFKMYRPLLVKQSINGNMFDEDLYQELSVVLLKCIDKFRM